MVGWHGGGAKKSLSFSNNPHHFPTNLLPQRELGDRLELFVPRPKEGWGARWAAVNGFVDDGLFFGTPQPAELGIVAK